MIAVRSAATGRQPISFRSNVATIALAGVVVAAGARLLGQFAAPYDMLDRVNLVAVPLALVALAGAAGWAAAAVRRPTRHALVIAALAVVGAWPLVEIAAAMSTRREPPAESMRLVQVNLRKQNTDPARAVAWVLAERPDIVTVDEAALTGRAIVDALRPHYPFRVSCLSRLRCSTMVLTRVAPIATGGLAHGDPENRQTLSAAWATLLDGNCRPFTIVAVHMPRPLPGMAQQRAMAQLREFLATRRRESARLIVAGDFNLPPWTAAMHAQDTALGLPRLTRATPTWPAVPIAGAASPPLLPIDHIYAGLGWRLAALRTSPWIGSDHLGLSAALLPVFPARTTANSPREAIRSDCSTTAATPTPTRP